MNYGMIRYILGTILILEAALMLLPSIVAVLYSEPEGWAFICTILVCLILGLFLIHRKPRNKVFFAREGFVAVALCWIVLSVFGAMPFYISGSIPDLIDAIFETASGFTTTGASILTEIESLPHCILFWRSFTHWIGGMGVLVFVLTVIPMSGGSHMYLMKAESPGPSVNKLVPKVRSTARILYYLYIGLTVLEILMLLLGGMSLFEALTTAFGTAGTGGFSVLNDSLTSYSSYLQVVTAIFMVLFGVNFNVYFMLIVRRDKSALKSEELLCYLGIIAASTLIITAYISSSYDSIAEALKHAFFQVASIITTTGFCTADFNLWHVMPRTILVLLMFIGACAGSTGGGIKVSRLLILVKSISREMKSFIHPRSVKKIRLDGQVVENDLIQSTRMYLTAYIAIFIVSLLVITLDGFDLVTNFTAVTATFNNIGPGLEMVGATGNYSEFSHLSKIVLIFDMLAGRLEILPMIILFNRDTWRKF